MLGVSLKRFKTNSVQPQPQAQPQPQPQKKLNVSSSSSNQLASYLQKKVSSMQAKKLIRQFRDFDLKLKRHPDHSVLFESDELLTKNPKTPPKKSKTMPSFTLDNLNEGNEWTQELSDLPSEVSSCSDQKVGGLTRASTWVGKSIRNFLKPMSGQQSITEGSNDSIFNQDMAEIYEYSRTPTLNESTSKMTLHCRILQITNLSSSKAYPYTLSLRVTDDEPQTYSGIMKRVARGVSTSNPHATLSFPIKERFMLDCNLSIQVSNSLGIVDRLKKLGRSNSTGSSNSTSRSDNVINAHLQLDSGDDILSSFANKGIGRYAIQTSPLQNPSLALELTVSFWLEQDDTEEFESHIERDVLMFCQGGDYLTFYIKGESYPTWVRYWVTFEKNQLLLRLNERRGEPVERIPIENLTDVNTHPSDDIQEEIYLGKKHGMVLSFGHGNVIYLFADTSKNLRYWQSLLNALTSETTDSEQKIKKRYIWTQEQ